MRDVHPWLKNQTERLLMRHDPRYKRRVVDRPLGVFRDPKRPKDGRRGDVQRSAKASVDDSSVMSTVGRHLFRSSDAWITSTWRRERRSRNRWTYRRARFDPTHVRRPNPKEKAFRSLLILPSGPIHRFGLKFSGSGNTSGSRAMHLREGVRHSQPFRFGCGLPMISEHGGSSRNAISVLQVYLEHDAFVESGLDVPKRRLWWPGEVHL